MTLAHFDDLTKINVPFGLLDADTRGRLQASDGPFQRYWHGDWSAVLDPSWSDHVTYRIAPAALTQDVIPWDAIKPEYIWAARDEDGKIYVYAKKPIFGGSCCWLGGRYFGISFLVGCVPGTVDWSDSLQRRPSAPEVGQ